MTIDINKLRAEKGGDPEAVRKSEIKRGRDGSTIDKIIEVDRLWRESQFNLEQEKKALNANNKAIGTRKKTNKADKCVDLVDQSEVIKSKIKDLEAKNDKFVEERAKLLHSIGNIVLNDVPVADTEDGNAVVRTYNVESIDKSIKFDGTPGKMHHHELLAAIDGYNPKKGAEVAGHRGYFLTGYGAELNQALYHYGQKFMKTKGYTLVQTPMFLKKEIMTQAAELADFEETLYRIRMVENDPEQDLFLIATSEQALCGMTRNETYEEKDLPIKYCGLSSCFRKEAGSHGKDCWGIFRVHQFEKVEQFVICNPEESEKMHDEMCAISEAFLKELGLRYQVVAIASGGLNDAAAKKLDIEAWFPGYNDFRELVSCSNCTDFQSRDLEARLGYTKQNEREKGYVHLLNGTLCATERTMCCILENYQTETGIVVPDVLKPYMSVDFIPFKPKVEK